MPDLSTTGPGGTRVTAKVVLNPYEAQKWARVFCGRKSNDLKQKLLIAAREEAPVRSGRLRSSIKVTPFRMTGPYKGEGGVGVSIRDVPYAGFVRWGTKPHVIRARNAPALRFYWPKVGRVVFFKKVNHPGTKPNDFLTRAVRRVARQVK